MTAGGATISSGSATVGKTPRSSGIPVKPVGGGAPSGRKNSFDASSEQSFLGPNARNSIQYRSLPRPAKSSTLSVIGRPAPRPVSGTIDPSLLSLKPVPMASTGPRVKEPSSCNSKMTFRTSTGPVNQTDREKEKERAKAKAVGADIDCGSLKGEETQSTGESPVKLHGLRRTSSSKYPELSSPTTPRSLSVVSLNLYTYINQLTWDLEVLLFTEFLFSSDVLPYSFRFSGFLLPSFHHNNTRKSI